MQNIQVQFDQFVAEGKVLHNYANILELLLRLRQCCNHPYLVMRLEWFCIFFTKQLIFCPSLVLTVSNTLCFGVMQSERFTKEKQSG